MNLLETRSISRSFGGVKAVQDISFEVKSGEAVGLIGPNGSGKSTCVNLVCGVYSLDGGEIIFNDTKLTKKIDTKSRARMGLGRTFQTPRPFGHLDVYENVFSVALLNGNFDDAHKETMHVLEKTGLILYKDLLSSKLPIEKRKWLDLARILVTKPKLIMLDEVMAGLNGVEMEESLALVRRINKEEGITIVMIEHVMKAILKICSRVVVLNEGRVLAEGEPNEVLGRPNVMEAYIGKGLDDA